MSIVLGNEVTDKVSGFKGIATAKVEYLNGCIQYCVAGKSIDGKPGEILYIDQQQLEVTGTGIVVTQKETGGPSMYQPGR